MPALSLVCLLRALAPRLAQGHCPRLLHHLATHRLEALLRRLSSPIRASRARSLLTTRALSQDLVPRQVCLPPQRSRLPPVRLLAVGLARHLLLLDNSVQHLLLLDRPHPRTEHRPPLPDNTALRLPLDNTALLRKVGNSVAHLRVAKADNTAHHPPLDNTAHLPAA